LKSQPSLERADTPTEKMQQQSMSGNREEDGGGAVYETYVNQMPRQA